MFLSHAWEDKERFVLEFALKLRAKGVDAWLDRWELAPGDSLVDRLFEEGIKNATAVIVVLSGTSVRSKWVREELNAAVVKRINSGSRLIPVIIDDCEIPECLQSTVWVKIKDLGDYSDELDSILAAIFEHSSKPPIGPAPPYVAMRQLAGLSASDSLILSAFCEAAVKHGSTICLSTHRIWEVAQEAGVTSQEFLNALEILSGKLYIKQGKNLGVPPPDFSILYLGFEKYLRETWDGYPKLRRRIVSKIVNEEVYENGVLAEQLDAPRIVIDHVLQSLERKRYVAVTSALGGYKRIKEVSVALRRILRDGSFN